MAPTYCTTQHTTPIPYSYIYAHPLGSMSRLLHVLPCTACTKSFGHATQEVRKLRCKVCVCNQILVYCLSKTTQIINKKSTQMMLLLCFSYLTNSQLLYRILLLAHCNRPQLLSKCSTNNTQ